MFKQTDSLRFQVIQVLLTFITYITDKILEFQEALELFKVDLYFFSFRFIVIYHKSWDDSLYVRKQLIEQLNSAKEKFMWFSPYPTPKVSKIDSFVVVRLVASVLKKIMKKYVVVLEYDQFRIFMSAP